MCLKQVTAYLYGFVKILNTFVTVTGHLLSRTVARITIVRLNSTTYKWSLGGDSVRVRSTRGIRSEI